MKFPNRSLEVFSDPHRDSKTCIYLQGWSALSIRVEPLPSLLTMLHRFALDVVRHFKQPCYWFPDISLPPVAPLPLPFPPLYYLFHQKTSAVLFLCHLCGGSYVEMDFYLWLYIKYFLNLHLRPFWVFNSSNKYSCTHCRCFSTQVNC